MIINGDVLAQFGVRGMKWGVRKPTTRGSTPPSKRAPKEGGEKRQSLDMHSMSDTELRNAINRIKMQKEYAQLTAPPPKEKGRGRQLVENIVFSSARPPARRSSRALSRTSSRTRFRRPSAASPRSPRPTRSPRRSSRA